MNNFLFKVVEDEGTYLPTTAGYTVLVLVILLAFLLGVFIFGKKGKKASAKKVTFSAMAIALATVASMIKFFEQPMGGSVTLFSMLFIVLIGYWYGLGSGLMAGVAYGILQLITDPYIISFPQMMVDYIFAFGALGLAGIFSNSKDGLVKGYIVAVLGRLAFAILSGVIFFGAYTPDNFANPFVYSLAYNGTYLAIEAAITLAIIQLSPVANALKRVKRIATDQN